MVFKCNYVFTIKLRFPGAFRVYIWEIAVRYCIYSQMFLTVGVWLNCRLCYRINIKRNQIIFSLFIYMHMHICILSILNHASYSNLKENVHRKPRAVFYSKLWNIVFAPLTPWKALVSTTSWTCLTGYPIIWQFYVLQFFPFRAGCL